MKKNLLLNPQQLEQNMADKKTQDLFNLTTEFFEHKGLFSIKLDANHRRLPSDYYQFIRDSKLFATMLTPAGYGPDKDARWDQFRISAMSELLGFYGLYQYTFQVSVLGVGPIWMGANEKQKHELAQLLQEGHVFAFGMSERNHGADLYSNETTIKNIGNGKYIANGEKYYIGNSSRAPKITVFGKDADTGEYVFWVVDCRDRHCKYCGDIEITGMFTGQIGEFAMIEYPLTDDDILLRGEDAFALGLSTVNIGKTQTSCKNVGMATHALYEAVTHAYNRYLYGKRVTDMPHIKRALIEAWSRILMSRLYGYRTTDYFRHANKETDRRYLLFNPVQKARATSEDERAVILIHNVMAAKAYETDTYAETAIRQVGNSVRLEGTSHVNLSQAVKFVNNYFNNSVDMPEIPDSKMAKDDSANILSQGFGNSKNIRFPDYRKSYAGCNLPNVKILLEQAEAFKMFHEKAPMSKEQERNADFALSVAEVFATIVYAQLVFEKAKLEGIEDMVVDHLFSYLVRDINMSIMRQLGEYAGHFSPGQRECLFQIIRDPHIDLNREETIFEDYIIPLNGIYKTEKGVVIS